MKLWFTKFENQSFDVIVFVFSGPEIDDEEAAEQYGRSMIDERWASQYSAKRVEVICETPDVVPCFEPC